MDLEIIKYYDHLYILRERLDLLEKRFRTKYVNLYLLLGSHTAALIDTGHGMSGLRREIQKLIGDRDLLVFNTHKHFDHVAGNHEFDEVHIHKLDFKGIAYPIDLSFLKDSQTPASREYEVLKYRMPVCSNIIPLIGGERFDLGGIEIKILFTPGHTPGSICIQSSTGEFFTGDTINYGAVYLPGTHLLQFYLEMLEDLSKEINSKIFPGHEEFDIDHTIIQELIDAIMSIESSEVSYDSYLDANICTIGKFILVQPIE